MCRMIATLFPAAIVASCICLPCLGADDVPAFVGPKRIIWKDTAGGGAYDIEWARGLYGPWHDSWASMSDIPATGEWIARPVPRYFRVRHRDSSPPGFAAYYPLDGDANDASGHGNHGAVTGATPVPDRLGIPDGALAFNGSSDYIRVAGSSDLAITNCTVAAWVKSDDYVAGRPAVVVSDFAGSDITRGGFNLRVDHGYVSFSYRTASGEDVSFDSGTVFTAADNGTWRHIAVTCAHDGTNASIKTYLDGVLILALVHLSEPMSYDQQDLLIGVNYSGHAVGGCCQREFDGAIDDVRICGTALSSNEVWQLYSAP